MPAQVRSMLTVVITLAVLVGFFILFATGIYRTWAASQTPEFSDTYLYISTALAGLVGGIVAAGFGQKLPQRTAIAQSLTARNMNALGTLVLGGQTLSARETVASVYAGIYILLGLAAIATWVARPDVTPDLVKNLASVSFGLFVVIAQVFLSEPPP